MAMQTGVSSSKVLILLGAGLTGSAVLRSGRLSEVISELQELMKGVNNVDGSSHYSGALLAAQIKQLAQEVRELASSRSVTIFNGERSNNGNMASYILPAAAIGAAGYCYMWWKGLSLSDVMFVTKRNMANAVATVSKQLEQVSEALTATKRHLSQRLQNLDDKVEDQKETTKVILNEVSDVKTDLSQIGFDLEAIQHMVSGLEGKIGLLEGKQDMTNAGVWYLCKTVGGIKDGFNTTFFQDAAAKFSIDQPTPAYPQDVSAKGLQFITETMEPVNAGPRKEDTITTLQKDITKPSKNIVTKTGALHRSYPCGITLSGQLF